MGLHQWKVWRFGCSIKTNSSSLCRHVHRQFTEESQFFTKPEAATTEINPSFGIDQSEVKIFLVCSAHVPSEDHIQRFVANHRITDMIQHRQHNTPNHIRPCWHQRRLFSRAYHHTFMLWLKYKCVFPTCVGGFDEVHDDRVCSFSVHGDLIRHRVSNHHRHALPGGVEAQRVQQLKAQLPQVRQFHGHLIREASHEGALVGPGSVD